MLLLKCRVITSQDASLGLIDVNTVAILFLQDCNRYGWIAAICRKPVEDLENRLKINLTVHELQLKNFNSHYY